MSTIYRGKINFNKDELITKYDKISFCNNLDLNLNLSFVGDNIIKFTTDWKHYNKPTKVVNKVNSLTEDINVTVNTPKIMVEDWINVTDCVIECKGRFNNRTPFELKCQYCSKIEECSQVMRPLEHDKLELMKAVIQCILYGLKNGTELLNLCTGIKKSDPEFLLKASLFCRREFNVRTISNYLLALAASLPQSCIYLKKYFNICINLPTDWIEVAQQYMIISNSMKLPAQLRKALISKFKEFNTYQIGKYQNKSLEVDLGSKKINLSLKSLIRTLHIHEPVDHVMSLLGKTYPKSNQEYMESNLPGTWDHDKAGKRMKVPIPETWETQISINGNKPEIWEKLIDNKKLPYMAMIRNLRNILQANVRDRYHDKVASSISNESKVINGKLLPFQYFTAFKILEEYNNDILKAKQKLEAVYGEKTKAKFGKEKGQIKKKGKFKKGSQDPNEKRDRMRKIIMLKKIMGRSLVPENILQKYKKALNKAVETSTTYNIPCIRGRVLILSTMSDETIYSKFKYGSSKSVKEVIALLTSMCCFASEHTKIFLVENSKVTKYKQNKSMRSILTLSSDILKTEILGINSVVDVIEELVVKEKHFDHIILFDVIPPRNLLLKYIKSVNPLVSIFINSISGNLDNINDSENILSMSGFNEHTIKLISEQSNGGFVKKVDSIDKRYQLENNIICFKEADQLPICDEASCEDKENAQSNDVNIFISSTFLDLDNERSLINKVVIPVVKRELKRNNINFLNVNCIDLRWGVPAHFGCSEKVLKYCIEQVKRCNIFVGVLGTRYGWIPDDDILNNLSTTYPELNELSDHSITHIEYKMIPPNCQKIFFMQSLNDELKIDANFERFKNEIKAKEIYMEYSPSDFSTTFPTLIPFIIEAIYLDFVGENPILSHFCMKHQRFKRQKLVKESVCRLLSYVSKSFDSQKDAIHELITSLEHDLKIKVKLHYDIKKRDEPANMNDKKMTIVIKEITDKLGGLILIEGKSGSGRTSLMAGLFKEFSSTTYNQKFNISGKVKRKTFIWFYDVIKRISNNNSNNVTFFDLLFSMIEFLMMELNFDFSEKLKQELGLYGDGYNKDEFWKPTDIRTALPIWNGLLKVLDMVENIQITFFLDGLEEIDDYAEACSLNWIPLFLSSKVRFVITAINDSTLSVCGRLRSDCIVHEIKPISTKFKRRVIENLLTTKGKSLEDLPFENHLSEITSKTDSDKPKYLELAINHLLIHATFDKIKETIRALPSTIESIILYTLKSIEKELSTEICTVYFSFIYHSRCGFRNEDLQRMMSLYFQIAKRKNNFIISRNDFDGLKARFITEGKFALFPLMMIRNLSHLLLEEDIQQRLFIRDCAVKKVLFQYCKSINSEAIHFIISLHYDNLILESKDEMAYKHIIYHKFRAAMFQECFDMLTCINYLKDRFDAHASSGLLEDYIGYGDLENNKYEQHLKEWQNKVFQDFKRFIYGNFYLLSSNSQLFMQQAINEPIHSEVYLAYEHVVLSTYGFNGEKVMLKLEDSDLQRGIILSNLFATDIKITCIVWSSSMKIIALGCDNGLIQLYNSSTFQIRSNLMNHTLAINGLSFIDKSDKLVSVGEDCKVLLWDVKDGSLLNELKGHYRSVTGCTFNLKADLICTIGLDSKFLLWKQDNNILHHTFKTGSPINCIADHNAKVLVGCWDGNMIIYNVIDLTRVAVIHNKASVRSVSINTMFPTFLATNIKGHLSIWNSNKGIKVKDLSSSYHKYPTSATFSNDGLKCVEYGSSNGQHQGVNVWSTAVGYHENFIELKEVCCIDANSIFIVCGTLYGTVVILDRLSLEVILSQNIADSELSVISINQSKRAFNNCFVVADYYCNLHLFQIIDKTIVLQHKLERIHSRLIKSLKWSMNYVVSGSDDCSINVMDVQERSSDNFISSIKDIFVDSILTVDIYKGRILAGSKDKSIGLFSIKERLILNVQPHAHNDWVTNVSFISSLSFISSSNDFSVKIWEISSTNYPPTHNHSTWSFLPTLIQFTVLHILTDHMDVVTSITYNKSDIIASSSNDGIIKLWQLKGVFIDNIIIDTNNGYLSKPREPILWIKLHEKNGTLLALNGDCTLHIFNFKDQDCQTHKLTSHKAPVTSVLDIDDTLYTSSLDTSVRQWNFNDILSSNAPVHYRITKAVHIIHYGGFSDVIVGFADTGLLIFWACTFNPTTWKVIETVDIKSYYDKYQSKSIFKSQFLSCDSLRKHNNDTIDILFVNITLRYDLKKALFKKLKREISDEATSVNVDQTKEDWFLTSVNEDTKKYFLRIRNTSEFLELFTTDVDKVNETVITKMPLRGTPCHALVFITVEGETMCFVAYDQGTVDFVVIKEIID